ncbi:MAG: hypothetical protein ABF255_13610 [Planktotalea arctica]|uniref:hypothetical protein n=1 Tax=Planktotalea arctica TaxID=1481893 RepID=UPI00321B6C10
MDAKSETSDQLLGLTETLEIVKTERDCLRDEVNRLTDELERTSLRAERAETRLHEVTLAMVDISRQAILSPQRSTVTEVMMDGRSLLRLGNPVGFGKKSM